MATFSKRILESSVNGKPILVTQNVTPGTLIHTGDTVTSTIDEVWLYAMNTSGSAVKLTIEWGDATAPDGNIELTIAAESGLTLVVPGLLIKGASTALTVKAFAATASVITINGYVNRIAA
ncbi:hypothetical protein [Flavobacterium sp.]|uniref:hypothetical protein n=1 Tax=Flavobacterium sp. TaxID=239 RepID=UPI003BCF094D